MDTTYTVTLTAFNSGCGDSVITHDIAVHGKPVSAFTTDISEGCAPLDINFVNNSQYSQSYQWDFNGDGVTDDISANPGYIFTGIAPGLALHTVSLISETLYGCRDTSYSDISVFNMPPNAGEDVDVCAQEYKLNASKPAGNGEWSVISGPGTAIFSDINSDTATVTVFSPGTYLFRWTDVTAFCDGYDDVRVSFHRSPEPDFEVSKTILSFPDNTIDISNLTEGMWVFEWDFGDGSDKVQGNIDGYTYSAPGEYSIAMLAYNRFCNDSAVKKIAILPTIPVADFSADTDVCAGEEIVFENHSENGVRYLWVFGDEGVSQNFEPRFTFSEPGEYSVSLTVFNEVNHRDEFTVSVTVHSIPEAYFEIENSVVLLPGGVVEPTNKSEGASSYSWDFGDGHTYDDFQPAHEYRYPGHYDVTLVATSENNCIDRYTKSGSIIASNSGALKVPNVFNPGEHNPTGNSGIATMPRDKYFMPVVLEGVVVEYDMKIFNRWGNMIYTTQNIDDGWDGFYKGLLSSQGVYIWQIRARFDNGSEFEGTGDVTLMR
jgi:PKD repeat protein